MTLPSKTTLEIRRCILSAIDTHELLSSRNSRDGLHPRVVGALRTQGFDVIEEHSLIVPGSAIWRDWDTHEMEFARGRRKIDMAVYLETKLVALIEVEHDLADLPLTLDKSPRKRNGRYAIKSIARDATGTFFKSYKSIERMAVALRSMAPTIPSLETISSDNPRDHNPNGILLFLVTEQCRQSDLRILAPRLECLGAEVFWKEMRN